MSIQKIMDEINFSGILALSLNGDEYFYDGGYRLYRESLPNNDDTLFNIASGTKWFTALSIYKLIEMNKLKLNDKVNELLDLPFQVNPIMEVKHLLNHTSGISDYFDEEQMDDFEEIFSQLPMYTLNRISDILPAFKDISYFKPGEKVKYSNGGYIILGLIIEKVSGITYQDFVTKYILNPLGITRTGAYSLDQLPPNTALGHIKNGDSFKTFIYSIPKVTSSDGGLFMNARDCFKLWNAFFNNEILSPSLTNDFLTHHTQIEDNYYFGFGMTLIKENEKVVKYMLSGYDPGSQFLSWYYPEENVIMSIFANTECDLSPLVKEIKSFIHLD